MNITPKSLNEITEVEWLKLSKLKGITELKNKTLEELHEKTLSGWFCLTPSLLESTSLEKSKIEISLWVKPEDWGSLESSVKKHNRENIKSEILKNWYLIAKDKEIFFDLVENTIKKKGYVLSLKKYWSPEIGNGAFLTTKLSINVSKEKVEEWAYEYHTSEVFNEDKIKKFLNIEEKWSSLLEVWNSQILPEWKRRTELLNDAQKTPWVSWVRKVWTNVKIDESSENELLSQFIDFVGIEEKKQLKILKEAKVIEAERLVNFDKFEQHFSIARSKKRKITFFMGPPNTGKTYRSFQFLEKAKNGVYLGPLRLLALEGHETLLDRGVLNDLITGEERRRSVGSTHVSSTVEMCRWNKEVDAVVLDEVQLLSDANRGWAWTQAFISAPSQDLVLTGSLAALPYVKKMVEYLGDELEVVELFAEKELRRDKALNNWDKLRKGDAIIAFSRKDVLAWKEAAEKRGLKVSVIYGHLSPEVRREEAYKFREGLTDYLIATDAIGLGLNLPIKRVVFSTLMKFDGEIDRVLKHSEAWQIANRAGRKGWVEEGAVTTWFEADEVLLWEILDSEDEPPKDLKWWVQPLPSQIDLWHRKLGGNLTQWLSFFATKLLQNHSVFKACPMNEAIKRSEYLRKLNNLSIVEQYSYATAPIDSRDEEGEMKLIEWSKMHNEGVKIDWTTEKDYWMPEEHYHSKAEELFDYERKLKLLTVYRWLIQRFPDNYQGLEEATEHHEFLNSNVERILQELVKTREIKGSGAGVKMKKNQRSQIKKIV